MRVNETSPERDGSRPSRAPARTSAKAPGPGAATPAHTLLAQQGAAGNAAVVQMLRQAGHPWARHRHGAGCGHEGTAVQGAVQRSAVHDVLRAAGRPMDDTTRSDMEARFGQDFSDVRIHEGGAARASASEIGARAYTSGHHIVIGDGGADRHTLAHELTHVVQQRQGPVAGLDNGAGLKVSDPSDRFEREAEANAARVMSSPAPVQRLPRRTGADSGALPAVAAAGPPPVQRMLRYDPVKMDGGYDADYYDSHSSGSERGRSRNPSPGEAGRTAPAPRQVSAPAASPAWTAGEIARSVALRLCAPQPGATAEEVSAITEFANIAAAWASHEVGAIDVRPRSREAVEFEHAFRATYTSVFDEKHYEQGRTAAVVEESARAAAREAYAAIGLERRLQGVRGVPDLPLDELIAPLRTFIRKSVADGEADSYKVTVKADRGKPWTSPDFYQDYEVGHVWIQWETSSRKRASFGFYPQAGAGPVQSVPGMIRCPEPHRRYDDKLSVNVSLRDVVRGYMLAHQRSGEDYNFLRYNCTSFAAEVWRAMTGRTLPRGMVVSNPASTGSGIYEAYQQAGRRRAHGGATGPFPYSDSEPHGN
ncbi:DUF4157 domain-containing protein [Streptomyces sp. NPDC088766]|uniref:eCIS core domain-containing protein n=1 Tax=Streptomyces sp. NPDC088766 TaxID=3365893 RepID=UPI003830338D